MATSAFDSPYEDEAARPPISLHPAFPAIVALWFAALLGVGSLVLPAVLLERMVTATGVAALMPAANPPLGFTARGIIAIAAALVGAGIGIAIARRVAQAHRPEPASRVAELAAGSRRPISVHDELGGAIALGGLVNGRALPLGRRRALAIAEDDRPSDYLYQIPLPGADSAANAPVADDEPLELFELAHEGPDGTDAGAAEPEVRADPDDTSGDFEMTDEHESASPWPSHQHYPPASDSEEVDELDMRKNLAGPRGLDPLPFAAPSLARRAPEPEPEPELDAEPEVQFEPAAAPATAAAEEPEFRADWATAPLDGLGLVQLVQRLGATIERRREWTPQNAAPAAAPFAATPPDFEPAPAEEAAQAMAAFFSPNPAPAEAEAEAIFESAPVEVEPEPEPTTPQPGFLHALAVHDEDDEDDEDDAVPDFSLPLRRPAAAAPAFAPADNDAEEEFAREETVDEHGDSEEAGDEPGYSSLLGMTNPFAAPKGEFVRIEEPEQESDLVEPAVVFPGREEPARSVEPAPAFASRLFDPPGKAAAPSVTVRQAPADADAALRAALATLQRMSGAA